MLRTAQIKPIHFGVQRPSSPCWFSEWVPSLYFSVLQFIMRRCLRFLSSTSRALPEKGPRALLIQQCLYPKQ